MNKNQKLVIVAIIIVSILLGALILWKGQPAPTGDSHGHDHAEHTEHKEHAVEKADKDHHDDHAKKGAEPKKDDHDDYHEKESDAHAGDHSKKVDLADVQLKVSGIALQTAGPARIKLSVQLPGEIRFNEDRTAHITPRLAGIVESVPANLGQQVKKGQVLAVIASGAVAEHRSELLTAQQRLEFARSSYAREKKLWEEKISAQQDYLQAQSALREAEIAVRNAQQKLEAVGASGAARGAMNRYEVRAPFDGMVIEKRISLGESVKDDASIYTISDLSIVWAEVAVPAAQLPIVRVGEQATVKAAAFDSVAIGKVAYVGSLLGEQTRAAKARIVLANPKGAWRPGLVVNVDIVSSEADVPVSVVSDAIQTIDGKPTIFVRDGQTFTSQPVKTGRNDGKHIEIVEGLNAGQAYAAAGSFIIKSELEKASAGHKH
jgi:cobalt-zinc-cadmium efflux system membrane fusion protein